MKCDALPKQIFLVRLFSYLENLTRNQLGFIPDIVRILHQYDLSSFLQSWLQDGSFPDKLIWKKTVRNAVSNEHILCRNNRMLADQELRGFCRIFEQTEPCSIWKSPTNCWDISVVKFVCKIYSVSATQDEHHACPLCNSVVTNVFLHASCSCAYTLPLREEWWSDIINTDLDLCAELSGLPDDELFSILLGRPTISPTDLHTFRMTNFRFLRNAAAAYNRALVSL